MVRYLIILMLLISCTKQSINGYNSYEIKKGEHESVKKFSTLTSDKLSFDCKFDPSAIYDLGGDNQQDLNKLFGFSECNDFHQDNSARFGWRWYNDAIEIFAYVYNEGVRNVEPIKSVQPNEKHSYSIEIKRDTYIFIVDNTEVIMTRTNGCDVGLYYRLFPFFGGDEVAPHDIKVLIKEELTR